MEGDKAGAKMASRKKNPIPMDGFPGGRQPLRTLSQHRNTEPTGLAYWHSSTATPRNGKQEPGGLAHAHSSKEPSALAHAHSIREPVSLAHSRSNSLTHSHPLTHSHSLSDHPSRSFAHGQGQQRPSRSISHSHWEATQGRGGGGSRGASPAVYPGSTPPVGPPHCDRPPRRSVSYTQAKQQWPRGGGSNLNSISRSQSSGDPNGGGVIGGVSGGVPGAFPGCTSGGMSGGANGGFGGGIGGGGSGGGSGTGRPPKRGHGTMNSIQNGIMRRIDAVSRRLALRKAAPGPGPRDGATFRPAARGPSQSHGQGGGHVEAQECDMRPVGDAGVPLGEWASGSFAHHPTLPRVMRMRAASLAGADLRGGSGQGGGEPAVHLLIRVCERSLGSPGSLGSQGSQWEGQPGCGRDSDARMQGLEGPGQGQRPEQRHQGPAGTGHGEPPRVYQGFGPEGVQGAFTRLAQAVAEEGWHWEEVEEVAWECVRNFLHLARDWPQALRAALRVLEVLEEKERQGRGLAGGTPWASPEHSLLGAGAGAGSGAGGTSCCQLKCYTQLVQGVDDRFRQFLEAEVQGENVVEILDKASKISSDLLDICQTVAPAFPPGYQVFPFLLQQYTRKFVEASHKLSARAPQLSSRDILRVLRWGSWLKGRIISLSGENRLAHVPSELAALDPLVEEYIGRMGSFLEGCLHNLVELERTRLSDGQGQGHGQEDSSSIGGAIGGSCRRSEGAYGEGSLECLRGPFPSSLPVDSFSLILGELEEARVSGNSLVLRKLAVAVQDVLVAFQGMLDDECGSLQNPRAVLVLVNASIRCIELAVELGNDASKLVDPRYAAQLRFDIVAEGFRDVAGRGAQRAVKCSFQKEGLRCLATEMCAEEWEGEGEAAARLAEASETVLGFWEEGLLQEAFQLAARALLEKMTLIYIERLVGRRRPFSPSDVAGLSRGMELLMDLFTRHIGREAVKDRVQIFDSLCGIASAESGEEVVQGYAAMITSTWPECNPRLVEKLVSLRADICKEDAMDIVERCREAWAERQNPQAQERVEDELALS